MSDDLRSTIKRVVDDELAAHPAPLPDLRGRTIHAAAGRMPFGPTRRLRHLRLAAAVAVVIAALGTFLAIQVRFHPASAPAHPPTRPVTVVPSPSAEPTPTPSTAPSVVASAPPLAAGVRGTPPGDMTFPSAFYDPSGQRVVLFGSVIGQAVGTEQPPQTWVWQGDAWFKLSPTTTPAPTWYQNAVTMGADGPVIVVGGMHPSSSRGPAVPTWRWDGHDWTLLNPRHSPPAGLAAGLAYDPARGNAVLFTQGQTWTWDGSDWTQQHPATSPPARERATMATSPDGNGVMLFGGNVPANTTRTYGDTWLWDGTTWRQVSPAAGPSARDGAAAVYDRAAGRVLLFGGRDDATGQFYSDTWSWDGSRWSRLIAVGPPASGGWTTLGVNDSTGQIVMFGQFNQDLPSRRTQTWTWSGSAWVQR